MTASALLPLVIGIPFLGAGTSLILGRCLRQRTGVLMTLAAAAAFALTLEMLLTGSPAVFAAGWLPSLGIELRFRGDPFGLFFALLVSGVGALVGVYSTAYVSDLPPHRLGRYYAALIAFMGAMLGLVLADDLILLFVFWELTSVTSFLLIGFWYERDDARAGAVTALLVTALGGLALLAGAVLVGLATGTYTLSALAGDPTVRSTLAASPACLPALLLLLLGAFTKSAQLPFHFWLPGAMVAPTPVSAYLHAATMVKAGIVLLARLLPIFGEHPAWTPLLVTVGLATFVLGAWQAFHATDLKAMLARTTVSALGFLTLGYGLQLSAQDALHILSHATYKGALFLVAGIIEHATHTRDIRQLGGLRRTLPLTFTVAVLAALSMAGFPPFLGFLSKEAFYQGVLETGAVAGGVRAVVIAGAVLANALTLAVALRLLAGVFLGPLRMPVAGHHAEPPGLWLPPALLAATGLGLGALGASSVTERLFTGLSSDPHAHLHVSLWPAHAAPLLLSLATIALGLVLYRVRPRLEARRLGPALPDMQQVWDRALDGVYRFAVAYSSRWQSGSLRWYLSATLGFTVLLLVYGLSAAGVQLDGVTVVLDAPWFAVAIAALTIVASFGVARAETRLAAALALTAVGFLVSLLFVVYRSPDILLTQILIETVSTIFILLVLFFMPPFRRDGLSPGQTAWNVSLSTAVGAVMFVLTVLCTAPGLRETRNLAGDYLARALTEAGGANAVNVIIVDFRAMDTIGEITVLVVVGLCVFGLLRAARTATA